ncbi:Kae1-like domain-containing protein [Sansalvadorimonas verongulae]|uniref:Kae1-like domain-containing protein n=1 Tax=Sansalvadorimonas verongulae TaxID=2172824 RepID=UPI0012BBCC8C|nr:hypothetical protein [Sansalvadorimonas verongulae]MTI14553.1 hypothetical protein [Sansalvadorimonas verongulae]
MKTIRFTFSCTQPVPFYARLCNHYLKQYNDTLALKVAEKDDSYILEANGEQHELEALADSVSKDFILSCWLTDARVQDITESTERLGADTPLKAESVGTPFCHQCLDSFSNPESAQFGNIAVACSCCHGEINTEALTLADIQHFVTTLNSEGQISLSSSLTLSLTPFEGEVRQHLLICSPEKTQERFQVSPVQLQALSSLEKPLLSVSDEGTLYEIAFANTRLLTVLCKLLSDAGIDQVYMQGGTHPRMLRLKGQWIAQAQQAGSLASDINDQTAGSFALLGSTLNLSDNRNTAVIYLSQQFNSQIVALDSDKRPSLFFEMPTLPDSGRDVIEQLQNSSQKTILAKFQQAFPEEYARLMTLEFAAPTGNLETLWAYSAALIGLADQSLRSRNKTFLADRLQATALSNRGQNAPRIDYETQKIDSHWSYDWKQTLGSLLSFRLAGAPVEKLAYGLMDSLADAISTWIEHLDKQVGTPTVALAGSAFTNELLGQRVCLRLEKNFTLHVNPQQAIDGPLLEAGVTALEEHFSQK